MASHRRYLKMACESCGFVPEHERQLEIHHVDRDRSNNDPANLQTLCSNCHSLIHAAAPKRAASSEQKMILGQLRALKRRRNAAAREEKYRLREMARQLDDLVRVESPPDFRPTRCIALRASRMHIESGEGVFERATPLRNRAFATTWRPS